MNTPERPTDEDPFYKELCVFFRSYAESFYSNDEEVHTNIRLKEEHTFRVCAHAAAISRSLGLNQQDHTAALVTALLHDLGRFEQYTRYRTFSDARSQNHSDIALRIIEEKNLLAALPETERRIIMRAVSCHNLQDIPESLDARTALHAKIIRDADKLDIIPLVIAYLSTRKTKQNPGMEAGLPDTPGYSPEIIDMIMRSCTISNRIRKNYNDIKLVQMSWMTDLNFPYSYQLALENKYHYAIARHLPDDEAVRAATMHIEGIMKERAAR